MPDEFDQWKAFYERNRHSVQFWVFAAIFLAVLLWVSALAVSK